MTASPRLVLAIDHGTTGLKVLAIDRQGRICGRATQPIRLTHPAPGWVETDARVLWEFTTPAAQAALSQAQATWADVAAIGVTNQRESVVAWDARSGEPAAPAIIWQCRRTEPLCERLRQEGVQSLIRARTGLLIDPYFSATKLQWLLENVSEVRALAARDQLRVGTIDSWLLWNLSGGACHVTDPTNASRTMLFDIHQRQWDAALLSRFGVPLSALPQVQPSCAIYGESAPAVTGGHAVLLAGDAGDQQAGLFGQRGWTRGDAKLTIGTGAFLLANLGPDAPDQTPPGLLLTLACAPQGDAAYALEGGVFCAGAALDWLGQTLNLFADLATLDRLAAEAPDSGGVTLIPAFAGLGAPHWRPAARGRLDGLSLQTRPAHLARAAVASIACRVADIVRALPQTTRAELSALRVDGGVSRSQVLCQTLADVLDLTIVRSEDPDVTARGATYLAGLACGFWPCAETLQSLPDPTRAFTPQRDAAWRAECLQQWDAALLNLLDCLPAG